MKKATKAKVMRGAEIGGAITAAVLAASAGAYLLSDKKNQAKMKAWALKAKKEVARRAKVAKKLGESEYKMIVDQVVKNYGSLEDVTAKDIMAAGKELKAQWKSIQKHAQELSKPVAKKKAVSKSAAKPKAKKAVRSGAKRRTARK